MIMLIVTLISCVKFSLQVPFKNSVKVSLWGEVKLKNNLNLRLHLAMLGFVVFRLGLVFRLNLVLVFGLG